MHTDKYKSVNWRTDNHIVELTSRRQECLRLNTFRISCISWIHTFRRISADMKWKSEISRYQSLKLRTTFEFLFAILSGTWHFLLSLLTKWLFCDYYIINQHFISSHMSLSQCYFSRRVDSSCFIWRLYMKGPKYIWKFRGWYRDAFVKLRNYIPHFVRRPSAIFSSASTAYHCTISLWYPTLLLVQGLLSLCGRLQQPETLKLKLSFILPIELEKFAESIWTYLSVWCLSDPKFLTFSTKGAE